jgi:hypothetical protein
VQQLSKLHTSRRLSCYKQKSIAIYFSRRYSRAVGVHPLSGSHKTHVQTAATGQLAKIKLAY